jgi:hypothetical protein
MHFRILEMASPVFILIGLLLFVASRYGLSLVATELLLVVSHDEEFDNEFVNMTLEKKRSASQRNAVSSRQYVPRKVLVGLIALSFMALVGIVGNQLSVQLSTVDSRTVVAVFSFCVLILLFCSIPVFFAADDEPNTEAELVTPDTEAEANALMLLFAQKAHNSDDSSSDISSHGVDISLGNSQPDVLESLYGRTQDHTMEIPRASHTANPSYDFNTGDRDTNTPESLRGALQRGGWFVKAPQSPERDDSGDEPAPQDCTPTKTVVLKGPIDLRWPEQSSQAFVTHGGYSLQFDGITWPKLEGIAEVLSKYEGTSAGGSEKVVFSVEDNSGTSNAGFRLLDDLTVKHVPAGTIAADAGVLPGMQLTAFNGIGFDPSEWSWPSVKDLVIESPRPWTFTFQRKVLCDEEGVMKHKLRQSVNRLRAEATKLRLSVAPDVAREDENGVDAVSSWRDSVSALLQRPTPENMPAAAESSATNRATMADLHIGMVLESVNGRSTSSLSFDDLEEALLRPSLQTRKTTLVFSARVTSEHTTENLSTLSATESLIDFDEETDSQYWFDPKPAISVWQARRRTLVHLVAWFVEAGDAKVVLKSLRKIRYILLVYMMVGYVFIVSTALEPLSCSKDVDKRW